MAEATPMKRRPLTTFAVPLKGRALAKAPSSSDAKAEGMAPLDAPPKRQVFPMFKMALRQGAGEKAKVAAPVGGLVETIVVPDEPCDGGLGGSIGTSNQARVESGPEDKVKRSVVVDTTLEVKDTSSLKLFLQGSLKKALSVSPAAGPSLTAPKGAKRARTKDTAKAMQTMAAAAASAASGGGGSTGSTSAPAPSERSGDALGKYDTFHAPLLSAEEAASMTVAFEDAATKLREVMERHGAAIVTGVASPEDCSRLEKEFVADLDELIDQQVAEKCGLWAVEAASHAARDAKIWPLASLPFLGPMERCPRRGLPQGRFAWAARLHPRVRSVYALLHGTEDLVSSCDNTFFAPVHHAKKASNRLTPHVDQNMHDERFRDQQGRCVKGWDCYQGVLYVWGSSEEHASTTVVWPGSHKAVYDEIMQDSKVKWAGKKGRHFSLISGLGCRQKAARLMKGWLKGARRLPVPTGALLLWNSRIVHQGWRGGPRLAQPVCWEPASRRQAAARERKLRLAALGLPSTHWASLGLPHSLLGPGPPRDEALKECKRAKVGWELPLRASIQPRPLVQGMPVAEMWRRFEAVPWDKPLPSDLARCLERSIRDEFKKVL